MKNGGSYTINKYKKGIVYHFQDGSSVEIDMEDFLKENPDKAERDLGMLKELSDQIYYKQIYFTSVRDSIKLAVNKIKRIFEKY